MGNELEESGSISSGLRRDIFESVHPDCSALSYTNSGAPRTPSSRGGQLDLCRYVGMIALGCEDAAEQTRDCERESWGLRQHRCVVYNQEDGLPWQEALSARAVLTTCAL